MDLGVKAFKMGCNYGYHNRFDIIVQYHGCLVDILNVMLMEPWGPQKDILVVLML